MITFLLMLYLAFTITISLFTLGVILARANNTMDTPESLLVLIPLTGLLISILFTYHLY